MSELCFTPARKLAQLIRSRKLSATEAMKAFIAQIERVNPKVNVIVTFLPDRALYSARKFDKNFRSNRSRPLAGLPIVGRYREDFGVLQLAHAFEQETGTWRQRPPIATA